MMHRPEDLQLLEMKASGPPVTREDQWRSMAHDYCQCVSVGDLGVVGSTYHGLGPWTCPQAGNQAFLH